jgi:polyketide synthase PksN
MTARREAMLSAELAHILEVPVGDIDPTAPFHTFGVDSLAGLRLTRVLEDHLDTEVELEWLYDYPSIRELAIFLDARFDTVPAMETPAR